MGMKAQAFQNKEQISMMSGRKTLEINPNHPVVIDLLSKVKANKEDSAALDTAQVLFQTALIESGYDIADPSALVNRVYRLMSKELGVDPDAPLKEVEVPEDEEEAEEEEDDKDDDEERRRRRSCELDRPECWNGQEERLRRSCLRALRSLSRRSGERIHA